MDESQTITIDAVGPMPVVRPATAAEVADVVRRCAADGTAVYPVGGGTMLDYGLPPARPGVAVELRALDRVIDFPAGDMTITVEAGITIARLAEIARAEGLHLPIDVPDPERATLGGAIACNVSGPRRYGYGTFRDYVLGITTVNDRGELVSAGGRVVKNVAGYDLMKLHTGALGTLGVITQVTLKLKPMPESAGLVDGSFAADQLASVVDHLQQTATRPTFAFAIFYPGRDSPRTSSESSWMLLVGFDGNRETVAWQIERLTSEFHGCGLRDFNGKIDGPADRGLAFRRRWIRNDEAFHFRAAMRPSGLPEFCEKAISFGEFETVTALPGSGVVEFGFVRKTGWPMEPALDAAHILLDRAAAQGGNVIIERKPPEWKKSLPIWGRPPADLALQKAVKRALDPKNIFNPGRFVTDAF